MLYVGVWTNTLTSMIALYRSIHYLTLTNSTFTGHVSSTIPLKTNSGTSPNPTQRRTGYYTVRLYPFPTLACFPARVARCHAYVQSDDDDDDGGGGDDVGGEKIGIGEDAHRG